MAAAQLGVISGRETPEEADRQARIDIQSGSERAFGFMARYGISGVIGGGSAEGGLSASLHNVLGITGLPASSIGTI
jgi:hypothetical protein